MKTHTHVIYPEDLNGFFPVHLASRASVSEVNKKLIMNVSPTTGLINFEVFVGGLSRGQRPFLSEAIDEYNSIP